MDRILRTLIYVMTVSFMPPTRLLVDFIQIYILYVNSFMVLCHQLLAET